MQLPTLVPEAKLPLADTGLEVVVRYPVDIRKASEIDDQVTKSVIELVYSDANLKNSIAATPKRRAAVKG